MLPSRTMRTKDPRAQIQKLLADRECRLCGRPAQDAHHLIYRSHDGDDVPDNLIPLCRRCHDTVHDGDRIARLSLMLTLRDEERAYVVSKLGDNDAAAAWAERVYGLSEGAWRDRN